MRPKKAIEYILEDYRGRKIYFNQYGALSLFGTEQPGKKELAAAEKILKHPDCVYSESKPFKRLYYIKRIAGHDLIARLHANYGKNKDWMLWSIEKIKVIRAGKSFLHFDQPVVWRGLRRVV